MPVLTVQAHADPYTVVILEGVTLGAYATGGVGASIGQLARVDHADIFPGRTSAGTFPGSGFTGVVTSGSGNIVTITFLTNAGAEAPNASTLAAGIWTLIAWGH